jgi:hypothetical protein
MNTGVKIFFVFSKVHANDLRFCHVAPHIFSSSVSYHSEYLMGKNDPVFNSFFD